MRVLAALLLVACSSEDGLTFGEVAGAGGNSASGGEGGEGSGAGGEMAASSSAASSSASSGGGGGAPECSSATDCADTGPCSTPAYCNAGRCTWQNLPSGTPPKNTGDPTPGDCMTLACDGSGGTMPVVADTDVPPHDGGCYLPKCVAGVVQSQPVPEGSHCSTNCTSSPCGVSDPYASDDIADLGVCVGGTCEKYTIVTCWLPGVGQPYGCMPTAPADVLSIDWTPGASSEPISRCVGPNDRGWCATGTPCQVTYADNSTAFGECL